MAPAPSPFPSPLVYCPLFPAKVRCVCARPSFGLNEVSAKQWVQQTRSSCRRMQNSGLSQFGKGAGGAATAVRTARSVSLLGVPCGEVPPSRASSDLEGTEMGMPHSSTLACHCCRVSHRACLRVPGWTAVATGHPPRLRGLSSTWAPWRPGAGPTSQLGGGRP